MKKSPNTVTLIKIFSSSVQVVWVFSVKLMAFNISGDAISQRSSSLHSTGTDGGAPGGGSTTAYALQSVSTPTNRGKSHFGALSLSPSTSVTGVDASLPLRILLAMKHDIRESLASCANAHIPQSFAVKSSSMRKATSSKLKSLQPTSAASPPATSVYCTYIEPIEEVAQRILDGGHSIMPPFLHRVVCGTVILIHKLLLPSLANVFVAMSDE